MNDFTKEELMNIADALFYGMATLVERKDTLIAIRGKVLEMIDNYCEHEFAEYQPAVSGVPFCKICQRIINDNQ